jgi:diguanylate cyclase (GGDEF)-like protein/PAS domain S-box-containing protein
MTTNYGMGTGTTTGHFGVTSRITRVGFADGWTGAVAIGVIVYVAAAIYVTLAGFPSSPGLEFYLFLSDQPAMFATALLAIVAARTAAQPVARRTWKFLAAALVTYNVGNLIDGFLRIAGREAFPSVADVAYVAFFPMLFAGFMIALRASSLRVSWGRLLLDASILVLGFGTFFWFFVVSPAAAASQEGLLSFALTQIYIALDCLMLMAIGVLLMNATSCPLRRLTLVLLAAGFGMMFLADIVWATAVVTDSYLPGNFSDVLYLACYVGLAGAAQVQIRDRSKPERQKTLASGVLAQTVPYAGLALSFFVLVYFAAGDGSSPVTVMTVSIFVLAILVMARQGVILRDDAEARQREAVDLVEARFASLIRNASDVIMIVDADGRIEYASPAVHRTFGFRNDDLVGRRLAEIWRDPDRDRLSAFLAEVTATNGVAIGPVELAVGTASKRITLECVGTNLLDDPAVAGLALNLRDVTERKGLEDQLRRLAFHDPLTLLANRSLFRNRVEHALDLARRSNERIAVLMIDLDNFKNVNDSLGHDVGDRLLQTAAQRLVKCTRAADTVARLGGDEFAVLLEGVATAENAERIAVAVTDAFRLPLHIDGSDLTVSASVGVALSEPGNDTEHVLRNADIAMYNAKSAGKGRHVVFHARMQEQLRERLRLEDDFNRALANNEFFLEFQPIVDLKTTELLGVEALVRWEHPQQGKLLPGQFIPMAEETGQIVALGRWVLLDACCRVQRWRQTIPSGGGLRVAVNVSGRHLQQADLVADVRHALEVSGLEPESLLIELTESTMMHNSEGNLTRLRDLKALGVRLAIDDFGTGYSSLSYLHRFPIDILKIDRSFITRLTESSEGPKLARAVVMLGETLGLETVAEGVEIDDQVTQLVQLGCVAAQGFLFSHATTLEEIAASPFATRREQLRSAHESYDRLTATGRYRVADILRKRGAASGRCGLARYFLPCISCSRLAARRNSKASRSPR